MLESPRQSFPQTLETLVLQALRILEEYYYLPVIVSDDDGHYLELIDIRTISGDLILRTYNLDNYQRYLTLLPDIITAVQNIIADMPFKIIREADYTCIIFENDERYYQD